MYDYSGLTSASDAALERLRQLSEQRGNYNAIMMRKAEDRYNAYMVEQQRRYDAANRGRPWWKKMLSGMTGGLVMGGAAGLMTGNPMMALWGMGAGAAGGGTMGALGAGGESGVGGMMPMMSQAAMMGAMGYANRPLMPASPMTPIQPQGVFATGYPNTGIMPPYRPGGR